MDITPMVWLRDLGRRSVARILTTRPIPSHVAFIMDGNRRFAESHHIKILQGHTFGYNRLIQALEWCLDLGITCVSVFAFSIDNYNRSQEEVATLMRLAEEKLAHMLAEQDVLHKHAVQVRVIGDLSLAPPGVRAAADAIMTATQHHSGAIFNICFSYTSSRELLHAMDTTISLLAAECTPPSGCTIDSRLYTSDCPPVDLLIRTSGESRLSDFMLRQSSHALLVFTQVLWPDFSYLDFASAVLEYQRCFGTLQAGRQESQAAISRAKTSAAEILASTRTAIIAPLAAAEAENLEEANVDHLRGALSQLPPLRTKLLGASESPCGVATPGAVSSPSSQSDASSSSPSRRLSRRASGSEKLLSDPLNDVVNQVSGFSGTARTPRYRHI